MNILDQAIEDLKNRDLFVRARAAETIRLQGVDGKKAVRGLCAALADPSFIVRIAAIKALGAIGPAAEPAVRLLIVALADEALAVYAASALGRIGAAARSALPALQGLVKNAGDDLRAPAVIAICRIEGTAEAQETAIVRLTELLVQGSGAEARACAAVGLGELAGARAKTVLGEALNDSDALVRASATRALEALHG